MSRGHSLVVAFWVWIAAAILAPCATFAYDGQDQTGLDYDSVRESAFGYDAGSALATDERKNGMVGSRVLFDKPAEFLAAKRVGSGPAKGFLEVSDAYASSKAVQNFGSARPTDFIFDAQSQRFIMGRGPLGHDSVLQAGRIAPSETTVGGRIFRQDGRLITDEWSGHYGQNWTPELRQQFQNFMQQHGVDITHTPWGQ